MKGIGNALRNVTWFLLILIIACQKNSHVTTKSDDRIRLLSEKGGTGVLKRPTVYWFEANPNERFVLHLEKASTGISLSLLDPGGHELRSVNCPQDGPAHISEVASTAGSYTVRLNSCDEANGTPYQLDLSSGPTMTTDDALIKAERLSAEADTLVSQYREDSRRQALLRYEEAMMQWKTLGDSVAQARTLTSIAKLYRDIGDSAKASHYIKAATLLNRTTSDPEIEAEALLTLATIQLNQGEALKAKESCRRALKIARSKLDAKALGASLYLLGFLHYESGDYPQATNALQEVKDISKKRADRLGEARAML